MNQYDEFKEMIDAYLDKHGKTTEYKSSFHETSVNDAESVYLYDSNRKDIEVINMDNIAQGPYRNIRFPESAERSDSISTNDAFVICDDNKWYFIEFKDRKIGDIKADVSKKAYCNWHMLLDIIYEMEREKRLSAFGYANPIQFARENVNFILVVSEAKNPTEAKRVQDSITAGKRYVPVFLERLQKYIYHDVFLYTPDTFERYFVKKIILKSSKKNILSAN